MKYDNYIKHDKLTEMLENVGFKYVTPHWMKRLSSKDSVYFCGSCHQFKHFKNDEVVKEFNGQKFSFVPKYVEKVLTNG